MKTLYILKIIDNDDNQDSFVTRAEFAKILIKASSDKDKVVGFAVYGASRDEDLPDAGEVVAIYVLSKYYDRKIGYRLMNEAFSRLKEYNTICVWVLEKNERAIRFYHRYGFEFDGCKKEWNLGTPVSIVRMIKKRQ